METVFAVWLLALALAFRKQLWRAWRSYRRVVKKPVSEALLDEMRTW